jgi:hypothetical protein
VVRKICALLAVVVFAGWTGAANALVVFFSFDNVNGNVAGTVSGRILGLVDNANNQAATSVLIDSVPSGLGGTFDVGNDAIHWNTQYFNSFSLSGGQVTSAHFGAQENPNPNFGTSDNFFLDVGLVTNTGVLDNILSIDNGITYIGNGQHFSGVKYSVVPAPATITLLGLGLAVIGFNRRKKA